MNWVDYSILAITAVSVLISFLRGFTREALSLAGWVAAFWIALSFSYKLESLLLPHIESPTPRLVVAFAIMFFATLMVAGLVNYLAVQLIEKSGMGGTDRMIGVVFGVARGIMVVLVLVLLAGFTPVPKDPWWQQSYLLHYFQDLALWMRDYLPPEVARKIRFD